MNARMTAGKQITLPDEVVDALRLRPGSEVAFERGPNGEIILAKADVPEAATSEEVRARIERAIADLPKPRDEFARMTTDEIMEFLRGE